MTTRNELDEDWNTTDEGEEVIYSRPPEDIDPAHMTRVVYELRLDIDRLNREVMAHATPRTLASEGTR